MRYPLLRRLRLSSLDQQVARASMQICHKIVMQQLYISRVDVQKQWVVISNPSEESINLTGYTLTSPDSSDMFHFPRNYTLLAGDQVTIWCSPGSIDLDTDNLLEPYLFWMHPGGSLRHEPFFTTSAVNEVLLLDPLMIEVASMQVMEDGKKEYRVLHCVSEHPVAIRSTIDTQFCVGCLSPPEFQQRTSRFSGHNVYVFSRYWDVVSDKSLFLHFLAIFLAPVIESVRALLIYMLFSIFQQHHDRGLVLGSYLRVKMMMIVLLMVTCDITTRRLSLRIKSGLLVCIVSFTSVVLDQLALIALYTALEGLYPDMSHHFRYLLTFELGISCINVAAVHVGFLEFRQNWHPIFKEMVRWDYYYRTLVGACGIGRELLLHLLLLLPFHQQLSSAWTIIGYVLIPLFTISTGMDFVRGTATLLHLVKYPFLKMKQQLQHIAKMR